MSSGTAVSRPPTPSPMLRDVGVEPRSSDPRLLPQHQHQPWESGVTLPHPP